MGVSVRHSGSAGVSPVFPNHIHTPFSRMVFCILNSNGTRLVTASSFFMETVLFYQREFGSNRAKAIRLQMKRFKSQIIRRLKKKIDRRLTSEEMQQFKKG